MELTSGRQQWPPPDSGLYACSLPPSSLKTSPYFQSFTPTMGSQPVSSIEGRREEYSDASVSSTYYSYRKKQTFLLLVLMRPKLQWIILIPIFRNSLQERG